MGTRIVDRHGEPYPTREVRRRMGFLGGDHLDSDSGGGASIGEPRAEKMDRLRETSEGEDDAPLMKQRCAT